MNFVHCLFVIRSYFAQDAEPEKQFLEQGEKFDLAKSKKFPQGFDIYKEPYDGFTHRPRFLQQESVTQYGVKNSCPDITWNLYGFPMPEVTFKFEGKEIEMGDKYSFNYSRWVLMRGGVGGNACPALRLSDNSMAEQGRPRQSSTTMRPIFTLLGTPFLSF